MNSHLLDFDRFLLILFAVLLLRVSWRLYSPSLRRQLYAKVRTGVQWLWLVIDAVTEIIPSLHLAGAPWARKQEDAYSLISICV